MKVRSFVWTILFLFGLLALFIGERLVGTGTVRAVTSSFGAALILIVLVIRTLRALKADGERKRIERLIALFVALGAAALVLYGVQSDLWAAVAGAGLDKSAPKLDTALSALWPALLAVAVLPLLLAEMSYASMQRAPVVEANRVRDAAFSGIGIASVLIFAFCAYYVAAERNVKADFSYFRTTRPGEATLNLARSLESKVEVAAFFPPGNEVREQVAEYLTDVAKEAPNLTVQFYDHALDPKKARELGVTGNGTLVVQRGERKELMSIGLELERARGQLRTLDPDFQKRLLQVAKPKKTIYFTTGHGERGAEKMTSIDQRWTVREVRNLFQDLNYEVRNLGPAEGLGNLVPADAAAVLIVGPTSAFAPEELESLRRYLAGGGRLLVALDPEPGLDFAELLSPYGLAFRPVPLANDVASMARTRQISDRVNLVTANFSSHPSVTSLGRLGQRAPVLLVTSGFLEPTEKKPEGVRQDFTVRSHPMTWADKDGDFELDPPDESRRTFDLAGVAWQAREGGDETRLLVLADSDALTDPVIANTGNAYLALDGIKWLAGEEALVGEVNTEEDKPIQHTRKQDLAWFYSTIFAAPALVLLAGFLITRRRGRASRPSDSARQEVSR